MTIKHVSITRITELLLIAICLLSLGCASVTADIPNAQADERQAKLLIYRSSALQASLADAYIGTKDGYFTQLGQDQYIELSLAAGMHELKVKAQGSVAAKQSIQLGANEQTCLVVRPNSEDLFLVVIPFLNALVPSFVMAPAACPDAKVMQSMTPVVAKL